MWFRMLADTAGYRHILLSGRLDVAGAHEAAPVLERLLAGQSLPLLLDLADVTFLASAGMRILLKIAKDLQHAHHRIILLKPRPEVLRTLEMSGFGQILHCESDEARAVGKLLGAEHLGDRGFVV